MTEAQQGRPVRELTDEELEQQGRSAHETRNWVFLHGTAEQFATHTSRMLELEQEYLRRYPKRTWQGIEGDRIEAEDPVAELLRRVAEAPRGRMNKLEVHQLARAVGLDRQQLARLYNADPPLLTTDGADRVITDAGRASLDR